MAFILEKNLLRVNIPDAPWDGNYLPSHLPRECGHCSLKSCRYIIHTAAGAVVELDVGGKISCI